MKRVRLFWSLVFAAAALLAAPASASARCIPSFEPEAGSEGAASGVSNDRIGRMVAPVMINGAGPYRFVVDTGANRSVVSDGLARRLGLQETGEGQVHTVHGVVSAPLVHVGEMKYGELSVPGENVPMLSGGMLAGEQGLLGVDGMLGRRLMLDFDARCIEIAPSRGAAVLGRGWTRVRGQMRFGHLVVVPGRINGIRVNVMIDTGSNVSLANIALRDMLASRARQIVEPAELARAYTAGQPIVLQNAIIAPRMELGDLAVHDMRLYVDDFHIFSLWEMQHEPSVLIGMDVLTAARAMAIDYGRSTVYFRLRGPSRAGARLDDATFTR